MSLLDAEPWNTTRLGLRPLGAGDAGAIHAYASDPAVTKYLVFPTHTTAAEAEQYLQFARHRNSLPGQTRSFALERLSDGVVMGAFDVRPSGGRVEVGYVLARQYWGNGYMSEVLSEAISRLLAEPTIHRIESSHDLKNVASGRVMEKAGMVREGIMRRHTILPNLSLEPRDMVLYAAVRGD